MNKTNEIYLALVCYNITTIITKEDNLNRSKKHQEHPWPMKDRSIAIAVCWWSWFALALWLPLRVFNVVLNDLHVLVRHPFIALFLNLILLSKWNLPRPSTHRSTLSSLYLAQQDNEKTSTRRSSMVSPWPSLCSCSRSYCLCTLWSKETKNSKS